MDDQETPSRRARHLVGRSHGRRSGLIVTGIAILIVATVATAYSMYSAQSEAQSAAPNPLRPIGRTTSSAAGSDTNTTNDAKNPTISKILRAHPSRPLNHDHPLQVWVGGDSLSGELGPSLSDELSPTGVVQVTVDFKVGSGLHDNGLRNWPQRVPDQMAANNPDVAIFMIGANDAGIVTSRESDWAPRYRTHIANMMDLLGGPNHRTVYWVGPPPMRSANLERGALALSLLMADEAKHHDNVVFVDAYTLFANVQGHYTNRIDLPALNKTNVLVRISDGVHFTNDGADWLAYQVAQLLDSQWDINKQAGGKPFGVHIEQNGGSIPGYRRRVHSPNYTSTSSGTRSSTTTAPGATSTTYATGTTSVPTVPKTTVPPTTAAAPTTTSH